MKFEYQLEPLSQFDYDNMTALQKKAVDIVEDMDFSIRSFSDENGIRFYCLFDEQRGVLYDYSKGEEYFRYSGYVVDDLSNLTNLLADDYFKDWNYDIDKVFDDKVLSMQKCFLAEGDEEENSNQNNIRRKQ